MISVASPCRGLPKFSTRHCCDGSKHPHLNPLIFACSGLQHQSASPEVGPLPCTAMHGALKPRPLQILKISPSHCRARH